MNAIRQSGNRQSAVRTFEQIKDAVLTAAARLGVQGNCLNLINRPGTVDQEQIAGQIFDAVKGRFERDHHSLILMLARSVVINQRGLNKELISG